MTMAQSAPLAFPAIVPQEGWEDDPTAAGPQPGTAKTVSLSANRLPAETARPPVSGELVTSELSVRAESRGPRPEGRAPSGRFTGASSTGETAPGVRGNALPPRSLNSKTELRP